MKFDHGATCNYDRRGITVRSFGEMGPKKYFYFRITRKNRFPKRGMISNESSDG